MAVPRPRPVQLQVLVQVVAVVVLACCGQAQGGRELPGWQGETFNAEENRQMLHGELQAAELHSRNAWWELLSYHPKVYLYHNFLTHEECQHIVEVAKPSMRRSTVVDSATGETKTDPIRTSYQTFLTRQKDPVISAVERRIGEFVGLPWYHGEEMQVLRYGISEKYDSHEDVGELSTVSGQQLAKDGKQREATALLYLTDVEEGGETVFPTSQWEDPEAAAARGPFSACGARGVAAKPKKGDMLVFWSINAEGGVDHGALHAGCPVLKGEKWTATKWIHQEPFRYKGAATTNNEAPAPSLKPGECRDLNAKCAMWAAQGECDKNPNYMRGVPPVRGSCEKSCKVCK